MNILEIRAALDLITELAEKSAEKVMDVTQQSKANENEYEFIGFQARRNVLLKVQPDPSEEVTVLLDQMHSALARRISGSPVCLWWRLRPEIIFSSTGTRIGCRLKTTPAVAMPKLVVANG